MRSNKAHADDASSWRTLARRRTAVTIAGILLAAAPAGAAAGFSGASVPPQTDVASNGNMAVMITVSCPKSTFGTCSGTLSLRTTQKVSGKFRSLGSAKFSIASGKTSKMKLNLNAEGQKLIKRGKISPLATAASRDGHNHTATQSQKITLKSHDYVSPPQFGGY